MVNREPLDSHLLRVLYVLLTERSVTRAAIRLNQSQPAISVALKRLRDITGDPILVRSKAGMVPTERGLMLLEHAKAALNEISHIVEPAKTFDPMRATREFRIGARDYLTTFFIPRIVADLRTHAPHCKLTVAALGPHLNYEQALEEGTLDLVIGNWPSPPEHYRLQPLYEDEIASLISRESRFAKRPWTVEEYLRLPHVAPPSYIAGQRNVVDALLATQRLQRNVIVTLPYFGMIPYILCDTDLVFTSSRSFCEHYARLLPLAVVKPPLALPTMRFYQIWHERTQHAPECAWLRKQVLAAGRSAPKPSS